MHPDALQELKPGYYTPVEIQTTHDQNAFPEVKRIYTGDLTCYNLQALSHRILINEGSSDTVNNKYTVFENL